MDSHARCGWILDLSGVTTFVNNPDFFTVIHPVYYTIDNTPPTLAPTNLATNTQIDTTAQHQQIPVWPMVAGPITGPRRATLGANLQDANWRAKHIAALIAELQTPKLREASVAYAGLDINYEGLDNQYSQGFWAFLTGLTA